MRRTNRPVVEILEGKALLSGATSGLAVSLTVTPVVATNGTKVVLTFTETNVSHRTITVEHGPGNEGFAISQNGKTVWISNPGPVPLFLLVDRLKPGESITLKGTWDGRANQGDPGQIVEHGPQLTGTFKVSDELDGGRVGATVRLVTSSKPTHFVPPKPPAHFHDRP